jgi:hypothetical protein
MSGAWQIALTLLGLIGLGTLVEWQARTRRWTFRQMLLRLSYRGPLHVVLTTLANETTVSSLTMDQKLTSLGNLRAATAFSAARASTRNRAEVTLSDSVSGRIPGDLVLLGGGRTNAVAAAFLESLNANCHSGSCVFEESDESKNIMSVGSFSVEYDWAAETQDPSETRDFGLIVMWVNPFDGRRRRGILCAGFTSMGTHAAAAFLLEDFASGFWRGSFRRQLERVSVEGKLPARPLFWKWPHFAAIVEVRAVGGEGAVTAPRAFRALPSPRFPLTR